MITFLPFPSFAESAKVLDRQRLGKQRSEAKAILSAIYWRELNSNPWMAALAGVTLPYAESMKNHPARMMWEDYPMALAAYGIAVCVEWAGQGYQDSTRCRIESFNDLCQDVFANEAWLLANRPELMPPWLGDEQLHASHRSNLIRKDPLTYRTLCGWRDPDNLPYFWPGRDYVRPVVPA